MKWKEWKVIIARLGLVKLTEVIYHALILRE